MRQERPYPQVVVTRKAARALAAGHPWVYAGEVLELRPAADGATAGDGYEVDVVEAGGTWQGAGLYSERSTIRVRVATRNANDRLDQAFWRRRIAWAWQHRQVCMGGRALPGTPADTECCRVAFSEADGLPGLIVDRYGPVLVAQVGTSGMERLRPQVFPLLLEVLREAGEDVRVIYERADAPARAKEGLELRKGWWRAPGVASADGGAGATVDGGPGTRIVVRENGLAFDLDLANSQKTGFFLDQKYNRRAVRELADGRRVLDCFCHVAPFGLNAAAGGAAFVRCVDASEAALALARGNARLNGFAVDGTEADEPRAARDALGATMGFTCADVLEYLPALRADRARLRAEGGPFDLIVLDPPAFAKRRTHVAGALRGYRQINADAMRLLPRGGYLATCSCSQHVGPELLARAIAEAAHDASVQLRQVEQRQQAPDHPILWGFPQSHYLDFFIFQVV